MKNILIAITIILFTTCKAQIFPLGTSPGDIPDNAYIKDTNNDFDKYVGLWAGTWNGKTIFLELRKVKYFYDDDNPYYIDKIVGERKVITSNGQTEVDRISNFDEVHPEFRGVSKSLKNSGKYRLTFYPKDMCGVYVPLEIVNLTNTTMTLQRPTLMQGKVKDGCVHSAYLQQHGEFPINFPKDVILTKQ